MREKGAHLTPLLPPACPLMALMAPSRAVAGESGVAFISSSASEFIEMYMGLGAARVRDLFNTVRVRGCLLGVIVRGGGVGGK